jgi:hypothetical protein
MDTTTLIVVVLMTLLFFGSSLWMAVYSRMNKVKESEASGYSEGGFDEGMISESDHHAGRETGGR